MSSYGQMGGFSGQDPAAVYGGYGQPQGQPNGGMAAMGFASQAPGSNTPGYQQAGSAQPVGPMGQQAATMAGQSPALAPGGQGMAQAALAAQGQGQMQPPAVTPGMGQAAQQGMMKQPMRPGMEWKQGLRGSDIPPGTRGPMASGVGRQPYQSPPSPFAGGPGRATSQGATGRPMPGWVRR